VQDCGYMYATSILDLARVPRGTSVSDGLTACVATAQLAEHCGYERVWYAEHHNLATVASSAPAVLIAHVAAHTSTIRLGAGGVMLPNHAPLVIAEQFGTLATLHPGRIELGVGRAPGSDQVTMRAMRRDHRAADTFDDDVRELRDLLAGVERGDGVTAIPGAGTNVPIFVLGSSLYGARLAARLGMPYAFASHFAPSALVEAISLYRSEFQPSGDCQQPWAMAAVNVICDHDADAALRQFHAAARERVALIVPKGVSYSDEQADQVLASPQGRNLLQMMHYSAVGTPSEVAAYLAEFARHAGVDELVLAHSSPRVEDRLTSIELTASSVGSVAVSN
jgi:luciferase family oxidoreductase group 1